VIPRPLIVALQLLSRLPTPALGAARPDDLARAAPWVPLVGALIGLAILIPLWVLGTRGWVGPLAALLVWILVTGALHLDGLADAADALGAGHREPRRILEVMGDPHVGTFGVAAIALVIAAKLTLLASLGPQAPLGLLLVPAWARAGAMLSAFLLPPLKPGLGQRFAEGITPPALAGWGAVLAVASLILAPVLLLALLVLPLAAAYWRRRLGGVNGDCLGAGIEATEVLLLAALALDR
jgi:adenosylcobinamide-GDP ribazoletransferase